MAKVRTYVKHVTMEYAKIKDLDSILDASILKETDTGAALKSISSCVDEGSFLFTLVFERTSS
jgi:hypothetical protein